MKSVKPILITGSHRSGSTWVGKIIATSPKVRFIAEPLNLNQFPCGCGTQINYWFQYITAENEHQFYPHVLHAIEGFQTRVMQPNRWPWQRSLAAAKSLGRRWLGLRPLVKDPIALFSAEWLAHRFQMNVVVLIRHPAAFASSLKRLNWTFPFSHFLDQPLLIRDRLSGFQADIQAYSQREYDIIDQAILLWRISHTVIATYQQHHPDWIYLRHEDLSRDPLTGFQRLFQALNLPFSAAITQAIHNHSQTEPQPEPESIHQLKRDSQSNIWSWKTRLTATEIARIKAGTADLAGQFYAETDW